VLETASGAPSGFAFIDQGGFRTTTSALSAPGVIQRFDAAQSSASGKPTRLVEAPLLPNAAAGSTGTGTTSSNFPTGSGSAANTMMSFTRTLAPLNNRSAVISLTVSGFSVLPWNYDAAVAPPRSPPWSTPPTASSQSRPAA